MHQIYSRIEPSLLLHQVQRFADIKEGRDDLSDPKEFLQMTTLRLEQGKSFRPHRHIWKEGEARAIAQEGWVVLQGRVKGTYYDTDGTLLGEEILGAGDSSVTFQGGHALESLDPDTILYEIKTGPYKGPENDKVWLDAQ